jgi:hypothetical protein
MTRKRADTKPVCSGPTLARPDSIAVLPRRLPRPAFKGAGKVSRIAIPQLPSNLLHAQAAFRQTELRLIAADGVATNSEKVTPCSASLRLSVRDDIQQRLATASRLRHTSQILTQQGPYARHQGLTGQGLQLPLALLLRHLRGSRIRQQQGAALTAPPENAADAPACCSEWETGQ